MNIQSIKNDDELEQLVELVQGYEDSIVIRTRKN